MTTACGRAAGLCGISGQRFGCRSNSLKRFVGQQLVSNPLGVLYGVIGDRVTEENIYCP